MVYLSIIIGLFSRLAIILPFSLIFGEIPVESFFRPIKGSKMCISPDGEYVVFLYPLGDMMGVATMNIETKEVNGLRGNSSDDVRSVYWAGNEHIVFNVTKNNMYASGLYSAKRDRKDIEILNKYEALTVVDPLPVEENWVLAWIYDSADRGQRLMRYNVKSRVGKRVASPGQLPGKVLEWFTNQEGALVGAVTYHEGDTHLMFRKQDKKSWTELGVPDSAKIYDYTFLGYDSAREALWLSGYAEGDQTGALFTLNPKTLKIEGPIFQDADYDVASTASLIYSPYLGTVVGVNYEKAKPSTVCFDSDFKRMQKILDHSFPDTTNRIVDTDANLDSIVVHSYSDRNPGFYCVVDIKHRNVRLRSDVNPNLDPKLMKGQSPFKFKTKSGMNLEGYLTLPGPKNKGPYPMVTLAHGGPWARDTWGFDSEVQFLANRGYAVMQLNFRGSDGYPVDISKVHSGDFRGMVADLSEATRKLVELGVADPDRLAIMGASFGGYAAVASAAFDPDLYKCAISFSGAFDIREQMKNWKSRFWRKRQGTAGFDSWVQKLGDPETAESYIKSISPIYHVENIKIPIMLIHGRSDKVVSARQSKELARALARTGNKPETHYFDQERHSLVEFKSRVKAYSAVEDFLSEHLNN